MNIYSNISNAPLLILIGFIATLALVFFVYFFKHDKEEFTNIQRISLSSIKAVYTVLIGILLLSIIIETVQIRAEKPLLVIAADNSESITSNPENSKSLTATVASLKNQLQNKFNVEILIFGEKVEKSDSINFQYRKSNYTSLFTEIDKRYFNLNVGAVVLLGDGIYNEGINPEQYNFRIQAPVYTIGIGDTTTFMDQSIIDITHNSNVFINNSFPLEIELSFIDFPNSSSQLSVYIDGKLKHSETIAIPQPNYYLNRLIDIKTEKIGLRNVEVVLSPLTNEQNTKNNRKQFTIEVHDNKKEILILTQGPHPDIGSITQTLKSKANFNISVENINGFSNDLKDYDLVVLNQLPSLRTQHLDVFKKIKDTKTSLLVIVGPNTSLAALNNLHLDFKINPTLLSEESTPYFNQAFSIFSLPENIKDVEKIYPPLLTHFTEIEFGSSYSVLAYQKINQIEMNYPLMLAGDIKNRKTAVIFGEGIWRWRFHEYQNYNQQDNFNQIINKLFHYLTLKDDRNQFKIQYERICSETSPIKFKAQVFDNIFESVNNAEVSIDIIDSLNNVLSYVFDANQNNYNLNIGYLTPGNYSFKSKATLGNNTFTKEGSFSVQEVNIEQQNLQSNFKTLNIISANTSGKFYSYNEYNNLIEELKNNKQISIKKHSEKNISELINWKWFVLAILLLLSLEWFLRKFWGSY